MSSKKHFAELDLQHGGKTAGINMIWRNYVTVTLCIVAACYGEICHLRVFVGLSATLSTKSTKSGSRYFVNRLSEGKEIWQIGSSGLAVCQSWDWWTLVQGSLWCAKIQKGVKSAFLLNRLAERYEIWQNKGHWCTTGLKRFWWTLVHFSRSKKFQQRIAHTLLVWTWWNLAASWVLPFDTYSPKFGGNMVAR